MKYKPVRVPCDVYKKLKERQDKMSNDYFRLTGKKKKIPLTRVLKLSVYNPINLFQMELIKEFKKSKARGIKAWEV